MMIAASLFAPAPASPAATAGLPGIVVDNSVVAAFTTTLDALVQTGPATATVKPGAAAPGIMASQAAAAAPVALAPVVPVPVDLAPSGPTAPIIAAPARPAPQTLLTSTAEALTAAPSAIPAAVGQLPEAISPTSDTGAPASVEPEAAASEVAAPGVAQQEMGKTEAAVPQPLPSSPSQSQTPQGVPVPLANAAEASASPILQQAAVAVVASDQPKPATEVTGRSTGARRGGDEKTVAKRPSDRAQLTTAAASPPAAPETVPAALVAPMPMHAHVAQPKAASEPAVAPSETEVRVDQQAPSIFTPVVQQASAAAPAEPAPMPTEPTEPFQAPSILTSASPADASHAEPAIGLTQGLPQEGAVPTKADVATFGAALETSALPDQDPQAQGLPTPLLGQTMAPAANRPISPQHIYPGQTPPPAGTVSAQPGRIGKEMGVEIARRISTGQEEMLIRLNPQEMGRIEVRLSFDDSGTVRAVMASESPAALDMLRRDSGDLARSLADAGIRSDSQSFKFDRGGGDGNWQRGHSGGGQQGRNQNQHAFHGGADEEQDQSHYRQLRGSGQVNLIA